MIAIPEVVEKIVVDSPLLEEGLSAGIINLSTLARKIRPQVESKLVKTVQVLKEE